MTWGRRRWLAMVPLAGALIGVGGARGEAVLGRSDISVSLRGDGWSGDRRLDDLGDIGVASVWVKGTQAVDVLGGGVAFDARLTGDTARRDKVQSKARVRELYWRQRVGDVMLKVGRQITPWGRADGINPTDNLAPRDFTLLVPEDGDMHLGREAVQAVWDRGGQSWTLWWSPLLVAHEVPLPTLPMATYVRDENRHVSDWAVKWDQAAEGIDFSVSYFSGHELWPDVSLGALSMTGARVNLDHGRTRVLGFDFSLTRGAIVWRGEAAWSQPYSEGRPDFQRKRPQVLAVAGPEWNGGSTTLGVQLILQRVFNFSSNSTSSLSPIEQGVATLQSVLNNQTQAFQYGVSARLSRRWLSDNLLTEVSLATLGPVQHGVIRTKVDYALDDRWHVQMGVERYWGPDDTFFGSLKKNSLAYIQWRCSF